MKPEAKLKAKIRNLFKSDEFFLFHYPVGIVGVPGMPDYLGFLKAEPYAIPFAIEVKASGKKLTPHQAAKKHLLEDLGVYVLSPCDNIDAAREFREMLLNIKRRLLDLV